VNPRSVQADVDTHTHTHTHARARARESAGRGVYKTEIYKMPHGTYYKYSIPYRKP